MGKTKKMRVKWETKETEGKNEKKTKGTKRGDGENKEEEEVEGEEEGTKGTREGIKKERLLFCFVVGKSNRFQCNTFFMIC